MVLVDVTDAVGRYRLLGPIRHYALERLEASGEATKYWARLAAASRYFAQIGEAAPVEPTEIPSQDQLEAEHDDLRIEPRWAVTNQDRAAALRCSSALLHLWEVRGHRLAGCASVQQALASRDDSPALYHGRAHNALTALYCQGAHIDSAQPIAG